MKDLYTQFDGVFFEKTRLSILTILYREGNVSFNRLKKVIGGTDGAVYTHLKKLLAAGYIRHRKEIAGNNARTVYSLTKTGSRLFNEYLNFLEHILTNRVKGNQNAE